ncbi:hypothetical protein INR49_012278 [Caranx melampygus]|nr:hypothetical protein INR49_012278 [Caranx melampygus]
MASAAHESDEDFCSGPSESDESCESNSDEDSYEEDCQSNVREPCKYYNNGRCRDGDSCPYLHVCKYALKGNCKYGSSCKLNHPRAGRESSRGGSRERSASRGPVLTDGRYYQWQLNDGSGWEDVDNDHVIEAQYCLPHTKSIKIYNTPYGAVSIDFHRMRVYGKSLRVRQMRQVSKKKKRKVTRRPVFRQQARAAAAQVATGVGNISLGTKPQWQFEGKNGAWYDFKRRSNTNTECSVTSEDIEKKYQLNPQDSMTFKVNGNTYKLDFRAMMQTNLRTKQSRRVKRVLV